MQLDGMISQELLNFTRRAITRFEPGHSIDSGRTAASSANYCQTALTVCGKNKACPNVLFGELREIDQNFWDAHSPSEIFKYVGNSDPHASNARLPASLSGLDRDDSAVVHGPTMLRSAQTVKAVVRCPTSKMSHDP